MSAQDPLVESSALVEPVETKPPTSVEPPSLVEPVETKPTPPAETLVKPLTATANLIRLLCIAVACAAAIFGVLSIGTFTAQIWHPSPGLAVAAWAASFGLPVTLGVCSRWASVRALRLIVAAEVFCFIAITGFWLLVRPDPLPAGADIPWAITFTGVPCVAVAIFARGRTAWAFTILACTLSGLVRFNTSAEANPALIGLADGLYSLLLVSIFVALTLAARRAAARVDDATLLTRQAEAERAAKVARRQERLSIDALVHDSVISTLLMAGLGRTAPAVVAEHASKTLWQLDALRSPPVQPVVLVSDLLRRLTRLTRQIAPDAVVRVDNAGTPSGVAPVERTVPSDAVAAILGAVGEALRNSVASAGPGPRRSAVRAVHRTVTVLSTSAGFQVTVSDDGVGFEPARVPPERLGISESIVGRMQRVPNGVANVRSHPGRGTDIVIAWVPERSSAVVEPVETRDPTRPPRTPVVEPTPTLVEPVETSPRDRRTAERQPETPPPAAAKSYSLSRALDLSTPLPRLILALFVLVHGVLAIIAIVPGRPLAEMAAAYLAIVFAAISLMRPLREPFPRSQIAIVLGLCGVGAVLMFIYLPPHSGVPFAHWHLGAITLILVVLAARGQIRAAWIGYAVLALSAVAWAVATGQSVGAGIELVVRHAGTLLAGTLFVVGLDRTEATLRVLTHDDIARARCDATTVAALDEREAELRRVNLLARPTLQMLAAPHVLTAPERAQCLLVEARLRDAIRGRALFVPQVTEAVTAARQRGVDVTVLDDSGDTPPDGLAALAHTVAEVLGTVQHGRVTVRVLPAGRPEIATLVIESGAQRILTVGPDGAVRTP
ncbi:hypothetical protein [Cryobacterium arcticum]|uniref:Histidine kinase/HSP90-like ATPase domain-containing protein n=1 Tax=Cryobacterium arcticum TaxID=670052 RepID=A0A1B1BFW4_9MICO|nr:hypothetical protein [Cryobacterium arcticum]ANP71447.1 hypothetical protein PA27867_0476 [Cryobacterium arcticum]